MSAYDLARWVLMPMPAVLLFIVGFAVWRFERARLLAFASGAVLMVVCSLPVIGKVLLIPLIPGGIPQESNSVKPGAVVVLTGGIFFDDVSRWWASDATVYRLAQGDDLRRRLNVPLVIAGGKSLPGAPAEAEVVARQYGLLNDPNVVLDAVSRTTAETAARLRLVLGEKARGPIVVVTSAWHCIRAHAALRRQGIAAYMDVTEDWPGVRSGTVFVGWLDFVPSARGIFFVNRSLTEYAAIAWYLIRGRVGFSDLGQGCPAWPASR